MKISTPNVACGVLLLTLALFGLWLNQAHNLGSAHRMGPGYMPMLVIVFMAVVGGAVLTTGFFNGPDRIGGWPLRETLMILSSIGAFALLLESGGLMLAIAAAVGISALADRTQRPADVVKTVVFLMIFCWWVFIHQLNVRMPVWPQL